MLIRRDLIALAASTPFLAMLSSPALASAPEVFANGGIALGGTDPLGYFADGRPVTGDPGEPLMWRGAVWHFASAANREAFERNPLAYCPRFGGYCAFAVANGALAPTVPEAWTIHDGRLYLNASLAIRERWLQDIPGHIAKAEANWPGVLG